MADICKIHTIDPVWTQCNEAAANALRNLLSYEYEYWEQGRFGKKRVMRKRYLIEGRNYGDYFFFSGLVPRCLEYLHKNRYEIQYITDIPEQGFNTPHLKFIQLRDYQKELVHIALEKGYGVIKAATGSGKSVIIYGLMSCFPEENILVLVHSLDLVQQLHHGIVENQIGECGIYTSKVKEMKRIMVSTVQSYSKVARQYKDHWDVVIVDEGHHVASTWKGQYFDTLTTTKAPWRFGFTATLSDNDEGKFALEGLIGPVIGELTMADGHELGFLATPEIIFRVVELPEDALALRRDTAYTKIYTMGIVKNFNRTNRIVVEAEDEVAKGGSVLILVSRIEHMEEIVAMMDIPVEIVRGSVSKEDRNKIRKGMNTGKLKCTIATTAWTEGVNLPDLTMVINAGGGRSERETVQKIGRGLRKTSKKDRVKIIDFMDVENSFLDPFKKIAGNRHVLQAQSIRRWKVYEEQGWAPKLIK